MSTIPRKRLPRPDFGAVIQLGNGTRAKVGAYPLCQPNAPHFFDVEDEGGVKRTIRWHDGHWVLRDVAMAAENNLSRSRESIPAVGEKVDEGEVPNKAVSASEVSRVARNKGEHRRFGGNRVPSESASESRTLKGLQTGDEYHNDGRGLEPSPRSHSERSASPAQFISPEKPMPRTAARQYPSRKTESGYEVLIVPDVKLSFEQARAHAELDEARFYKGRDLDRYHRAIERVDRLDPGFYLGRIKPLKPLPRGETFRVHRVIFGSGPRPVEDERLVPPGMEVVTGLEGAEAA